MDILIAALAMRAAFVARAFSEKSGPPAQMIRQAMVRRALPRGSDFAGSSRAPKA